MVKFRTFDRDRGCLDGDDISHETAPGYVLHLRLADMAGFGRALGGRGVPFETPLEGGMEGREALRR